MNKLLFFLCSFVLFCTAEAQMGGAAPAVAVDCQVYILGDDSFELSLNGTPIWKGNSFDHVLQNTISLRRGDVVTVEVTEKQGGPGGGFGALILRNNLILASSKDFRYTVKPSPTFTVDTDIQSLRMPELKPLNISFGLGPEMQPKHAWTQKSDRKFATVYFKHIISQ